MFKGNDGYCLLQVIDKALTVLKTLPPNMTVIPQQSPMQIDHTVFYREQAWLVVQVMIIETLRLDYPSLFFCSHPFAQPPRLHTDISYLKQVMSVTRLLSP